MTIFSPDGPSSWVPPGVDITTPSVARVYDRYLGGWHNFAADREFADRAIADWPELPAIIRSVRALLRRMVAELSGLGVRQFLDLGSGIPTVGNVHEVAQGLAPDSRVVYVDIDPVAVAHSQAILEGNPRAAAICGDLRQPFDVLGDPVVRDVLDFDEPIALLMLSVLHFVGDEARPAEVIATYRDALVPGSYLAISHATHELHPREVTATHTNMYRQTGTPMRMRSRAEVEALLQGWDVIPPGIVLAEQWRPERPVDDDAARACPAWGGVGRLR